MCSFSKHWCVTVDPGTDVQAGTGNVVFTPQHLGVEGGCLSVQAHEWVVSTTSVWGPNPYRNVQCSLYQFIIFSCMLGFALGWLPMLFPRDQVLRMPSNDVNSYVSDSSRAWTIGYIFWSNRRTLRIQLQGFQRVFERLRSSKKNHRKWAQCTLMAKHGFW